MGLVGRAWALTSIDFGYRKSSVSVGCWPYPDHALELFASAKI